VSPIGIQYGQRRARAMASLFRKTRRDISCELYVLYENRLKHVRTRLVQPTTVQNTSGFTHPEPIKIKSHKLDE